MNRFLFSMVFCVASMVGFSDRLHAQHPSAGFEMYYNSSRGSSFDLNVNNHYPGLQNHYSRPAQSFYPPAQHYQYQPNCNQGLQSNYRWVAPNNNGYYGNYPSYRR